MLDISTEYFFSMNENILNLQEQSLESYIEEIRVNFEEQKHQLTLMITNMPQKHSMINCIAEELEKTHGKEKIVQLEIDTLQYASKDFLLLTNALLYLERRWNTEIIRKIIEEACDIEQFKLLLSLVTDPTEEDVVDVCDVKTKIAIPSDTTELRKIYDILAMLHHKEIISSIRDTFTAYKILQAYNPNAMFISGELSALMQLESVSFSDAIGGILLDVIYRKKDLPYLAYIIIKITRRNRIQMQLLIQLCITAYNKKDEVWEGIQEIIPHLYMRMGIDRRRGYCLLHTLTPKNAVFVYEMLDGDVPEIEVFDKCIEGRTIFPDEETRKHVRALLNIPQHETYFADTPYLPQMPEEFSYKPPADSSSWTEDKMYFYCFFINSTHFSITHVNNTLIKYAGAIKNMTQEEIDLFVRVILSVNNSLVHKEITVHKLHCIRNG